MTAQLGGVPAAGPLTVKVGAAETCPPLAVPTDIAPTPTVPAENVISLFGTAYPARTGGLLAHHLERLLQPVHADDHRRPRRECTRSRGTTSFPSTGSSSSATGSANLIDASAMTWFHIDVWTPNGYAFDVKLVNDPGRIPVRSRPSRYYVPTGTWTSLEIPMTAFRNLGGTSKLGQMLFLVPDGTSATFYVDNIYFHN